MAEDCGEGGVGNRIPGCREGQVTESLNSSRGEGTGAAGNGIRDLICDRKYLKGGSCSGVPKFIVETLSPSTAKRDKTEKKDIYEKAGVEAVSHKETLGNMTFAR